MSPEQESNAEKNRQLDDCAYQLADICREIHKLRVEVANLAEDQLAEQREANMQSFFERIEKLKSEQEQVFPLVDSEICALIAAYRMDSSRYDEILQETRATVLQTLHKFSKLEDPGKYNGSRFRSWLRTRIKWDIANHYRAIEKGSSEKLNQKQQKRFAKTYGESINSQPPVSESLEIAAKDNRLRSQQEIEPFRKLPHCFTEEEEQQIASLPEQCRVLFLFSTGLWSQLSPERQRTWADAKANEFELTRLNAIARANRFVLRAIEDDLARNPIDWDEDYTDLIEELTRKKANVVAQNLNRHFWRFMRINTAWQFLFAYMEPLDDDLSAQIDECLEPSLMLAYLQCDVYMLCDTSNRCFDWLNQCGFENSITHNLGRVAGQKSFIDDSRSSSKLRINEKKWEYACRLAKCDPSAIAGDEFMRDVFADVDGPCGQALPIQVAAKRAFVDLPLAFERIEQSSMLDETCEASDE